jgi:hypothetical protein
MNAIDPQAPAITPGTSFPPAGASAPLPASVPGGRSASLVHALLHADSRLLGPLGLLLTMAVWALARPYHGLRHDALLYAAQTIHHVWPERFHDDLFFRFGSQDRFSLFSSVMGALVVRFGLGGAEMVVLALCQVLFVVAVWKMAGHFTRQTRWLSVVCVTVFPHAYSGWNVFGFAENFLSARSMAEPLSLLGLVAWARHRRGLAALFFLLAGALHPLMVLPMILIAWLVAAGRDRRWLLGGLAVVPVLALAWMGVSPFDGLLHRMDKAWWDEVLISTPQVALSTWEPGAWLSVTMDALLLGVAAWGGGERLRRWILATLLAIGLMMAVSYIGTDLLHDVLISQLQLWRVAWIGHLFALLVVPVAVHVWWRRGGFGPVTAVVMVDALLAVGANFPHAIVITLGFMAAGWLTIRRVPVSAAVRRAAMAAGVIVGLLVTSVTMISTFAHVAEGGETLAPWLAMLSLPAVALSLVAMLVLAIRVVPVPAAWGLVGLVLVAGAANWDQRSAWARFIEAAPTAAPHPFDRFIGPSATVYWTDDTKGAWLVLQRNAFYAAGQDAGVVFHRETALEITRRRKAMLPYSIQRNLCGVIGQLTGATEQDMKECVPTPDVFQLVCHADPHPDFVVLQKRLPRGLIDHWAFAPASARTREDYYLYDCSKV